MENTSPETFDLGDGRVLCNIHSAETCSGQWCVIHNPMPHGMKDWVLHWREDRRIFERICPECGCGHYDSSQLEYHLNTGQESQAVHGCCEHGWGLHQIPENQEENV